MIRVVVDFETASGVDLRECGAARYWSDPSTEILCLCWREVDREIRGEWRPGWGLTDALMARVLDPTVHFVAHNAGFEITGWREHMVNLYGWPDVVNNRWEDTQATCAYKVLPLKLEHVVKVLGLPIEKDMAGSKFTVALSKPNRKGHLDRSDAALDRVTAYCHQDCEAELAVLRRVGDLSRAERAVWLMDLEINQRGVAADMPYVWACQQVVDQASVPLAEEFTRITGLDPGQTKKLLPWVHERGVLLPNLRKETIAAALGHGVDMENEDDEDGGDSLDYMDTDLGPDGPGSVGVLAGDVRRVLEIRSILGSASIKKLGRIEKCVNADWRLRNLLQYHAAGPGRWGGRLVQPQNFPRGTIMLEAGTPHAHAPSVEAVVEALMTGDASYVAAVLGDPIEVVAGGLRHALVASDDRLLVVGDFAGVEARLVLALAGQHDKTALMASGADVYCDVASLIFKHLVTKALVAERQIGKNTVLGCGFQMAWAKFQARYGQHHSEEFCREIIRVYREDWAPLVPKLWYALEEAANKAVWDNIPTEAYGVLYEKRDDGWLTALLPSGRKLWYWNPQPCEGKFGNRAWSYQARKSGRWVTIQAYGGLLTENVIQGLARDLLVRAMFKCRENNMPIVLTVHDEIVCDVPASIANAEMLDQIMSDRPKWAIDMQAPIKAECWTGQRYKK